ncbi:hypothetical protein [Campylobacter hyointestinalis]|uniref:hypothetical protein n=1 Tax=Campylobacter hyointestinalis TaxID=198 RepID=UPI000B17A475|nr:hypothetical protein [Campylobacter hyointestinalis]
MQSTDSNSSALSNTLPSKQILLTTRDNLGDSSMPLAIINPRGSSLTVWALAEGNWIW